MKPNALMLTVTTRLIARSHPAIRCHHFPINIAAHRRGNLLGFTRSAQPTRMLRAPAHTFVCMGVQKRLSKCHSRLTLFIFTRL